MEAGMEKLQGNMAYSTSVSAQPVVAAAWRGRFNIPSHNIHNINVTAHVLNKECLSSIMSDSLCLEMIPRHNVWPASFKSSPPTEYDIAVIFFSQGRDGEVLDSLMNFAIRRDIALKATVGGSELLIFTSNQLPPKIHRFQGKPYLWGVFRGHESAASHQLYHHVQIPSRTGQMSSSSSNKTSFEERERPIDFSCENNPCVSVISDAHPAKAERRGRHLDGAWEHARPLDALRQKGECKHCGFFSSRGGISRLKAHLGGGDPRIRLPGCPGVPPEVKKVMAEWFIHWVKNTKALWTKEIRESHVDTRGRRKDVAWEYSKGSDAANNQKTDFKYIDFTSLHGDASQHEVTLGEDPKSDMEAWPKASPETGVVSKRMKSSGTCRSTGAEVAVSERMKRSTASVKKPPDCSQVEKRGRPLDDAWNHAKPLDEARQKTQCNYCGFLSLYGGISRLKAHLVGGSPQMQLQGCPKVPPEVQRVMEQWFNEWTKYSSASWARKSPGVHAKPYKKGRLPDDTWQHAISLDEKEQTLKCNYCGFVCQSGGFARLRVHLSGGDPKMQLEGCRNVPLGLQSFMAQKIKKHKKISKAESIGTVGEDLKETKGTAEAKWEEKRQSHPHTRQAPKHRPKREFTEGYIQERQSAEDASRNSVSRESKLATIF